MTSGLAQRPPGRGVEPNSLLRFDLVQRSAHWANALLFGILMATALPLYFSSLAVIVGRRPLLAEIHLWAGVALPIPILVSLLGPWGARLRQDLRRINHWTADEVAWLRTLGGKGAPKVVDKFNPGQKLNGIFTGGVIVVMLATGCMLKWFRFFSVEWRSGATFVHDVFAFAVFIVVFGHILFAVTHPDSMRSMVQGRVSERWAQKHAADWLADERELASRDPSR
ncbi:MAG TPA: cytochrome b/b6 domain-containing protein [Acidimicrobiales bacterium]|jgi:formate dehydrogenase subunit gamma|nr:cytochrome b/b6 domain-containing protein [Acidimicrobiales bacterium]